MKQAVVAVAVVALWGLTVSAQDWDSFKCSRMGCNLTRPTEVSPCGSVCPPIVKTRPRLFETTGTAFEGWFAFRKEDPKGVWTSPVSAYAPTLVPNTSGDTVHNIFVSPDGEWIMYSSGARENTQRITLIRPDGTGKVSHNAGCYSACWYQKSPNGAEIAYAVTPDNCTVNAVKVNFSGTKASFGTVRKIGSALGIHYGGGEMAVGGEFLVLRIRVGTMCGSTKLHAAVVFTIPDGGMGTASGSTKWNVNMPFNCGITMNPEADKICMNNGRAYSDCIVDGHYGFNIVPTHKNTDPRVSPNTWFLGQGISLNWAPESFRWNLDLHNHGWTNHEDWIASVDLKGIEGAFLVNWQSNDWYRLTPRETKIYRQKVFLTKAPGTSAARPAVSPPRAKAPLAAGVDAVYYSLQGRRLAATPPTKGVRAGLRVLRSGSSARVVMEP